MKFEISYSASLIALKTRILSGKRWAKHLHPIRDDYKKIIWQLPLLFRILALLVKFPLVGWFLYWMNERAIPGELGHIYLRKTKILDWISKTGAKNLIILGSGFDATSLSKMARKFDRIIEIDSQTMISKKKRLLERHSITNVTFYSTFLDKEIWKSIPPKEHVLVISEGFWEYLSEKELQTLIENLTDYFSNIELIGTLYDFVWMKPKVKKSFLFWTSLFGEQLNEAHSENPLRNYFYAQGFELLEYVHPDAGNIFLENSNVPLNTWQDFALAKWRKFKF